MPIKSTNVQFTDKNTGEILGGTAMLIPLKAKIKEPWLIIKQEGLRTLALESDLGQVDLRILLLYLSWVDFENVIPVTQTQIADELGMHKVVVSKSIKKLVAKQILLEGEKQGRTKTYILNPDYGWRGKINDKYFAASANAANSAYGNLPESKDRQKALENHEIQRLRKDPKFQPADDQVKGPGAPLEQTDEPLPIIEYLDKLQA